MLRGPQPGGALLAHLRTETRPAHDQLEGTLALLDERLGLDAYRKVIERFYGFWRNWEPRMATLFQDAAFLDPRRRMHLLRADLVALGLSAHAVAMLPTCPAPILRNSVEALGSLYVMEGSTLGGRVIERNVERCLGLNSRYGACCTIAFGNVVMTCLGAFWC